MYTWVLNCHIVLYDMCGLNRTWTLFSKRPDWAATTENYLPRAPWMVRNDLNLHPPIASILKSKTKANYYFINTQFVSRLTLKYCRLTHQFIYKMTFNFWWLICILISETKINHDRPCRWSDVRNDVEVMHYGRQHNIWRKDTKIHWAKHCIERRLRWRKAKELRNVYKLSRSATARALFNVYWASWSIHSEGPL